MASKRTCPKCGPARVIPISCGEPKPATVRAVDLRLLLIWGCVMHADLPRWVCISCEYLWAASTTVTRPR